jgi:hypothetical protein
MIHKTDDAKDILNIKNKPVQYKRVVYLNGKPIINFVSTVS